MILFDAADLAAQRTLHAVYGEAFAHQPMARVADVNAPRAIDATRAAAVLTGIYRERDASDQIPASLDTRTDMRPGVSMHVHMIEIDPRLNASVMLASGDRLLRVATGQSWRIVTIDPDSAGRLICTVALVA